VPLLRIVTLLLAALGSAAVFLGLAWGLFRVATYEHVDDPAHVAAKREYLASLPRADGPNVVLVLFDDLGYGDLGSFGSRALATPRIDRLAEEGLRMTHYYAPAPNCTPSRAGLLTGRYPVRTGLHHVLLPSGSLHMLAMRLLGYETRLPADEILLPEILQAAGYATGVFGKWHLGDRSPALPPERGADEFYGVLYSNDMEPFALYEDGEIVEEPAEQATLTPRYTDRAIAFLERHAERPFFVYLAHTFPHTPLHPVPEHAGRSRGGRYGDVVEDLDRSVGRLVDALERLDLARDTLVIVTSDNGPALQGSRGVLRGRKQDVFEGGMRVPFVVRWTGRIPAGGVSESPAMGIDLVPTLLELTGLPAPPDRVLAGRSLVSTWTEGRPLPERPLYFYQGTELVAVRVGQHKVHTRHWVYPGNVENLPLSVMFRLGPALYDLERDPAESYDVSERRPERAAELAGILARREAEVAAEPRGWVR